MSIMRGRGFVTIAVAGLVHGVFIASLAPANAGSPMRTSELPTADTHDKNSQNKNVETKIVGSSTVGQFARAVQRRLGAKGRSIIIEPTGTRGGVSLFCSSKDPHFAPVVMASSAMTAEEEAACAANGIGPIETVELGASGVVVIQKHTRRPIDVTNKDLFLALAAETPVSADDCRLTPNWRLTWSDVRADLPNWPIEVYGPPKSSGTRASFIDLALKTGAEAVPCLSDLKKREPSRFLKTYSTINSDGRWIDAGENDSVIVAAISRLPRRLGVTSFPMYKRHENAVSAARIEGEAPCEETIAAGAYPLTRVLRLYAKKTQWLRTKTPADS
ncbi:MAG: substrate-binding domain-containing protein [Pseudomonadota bacterium]